MEDNNKEMEMRNTDVLQAIEALEKRGWTAEQILAFLKEMLR